MKQTYDLYQVNEYDTYGDAQNEYDVYGTSHEEYDIYDTRHQEYDTYCEPDDVKESEFNIDIFQLCELIKFNSMIKERGRTKLAE